MRVDMITTSKFLNETDKDESEQFFKLSKERSMRCHSKKLRYIRKDVKKYFYSKRKVDERNKLKYETVNADKIQKFKKFYDTRESLRYGAQQVKNSLPVLYK